MYHFTVFQLPANEESWWKGESSEGKGNTIQLIDDEMKHRFEVHIQS